MKKRKLSKRTKIITISALALASVGAVTVVLVSGSTTAETRPIQTVTLEKTEIVNAISVSGIVESALVENIYSTQTYPVREIFVKTGDTVKVGDVLAELDISRLENDIAQAEINLKSAIISAEEEIRQNGNSVINAQTSLQSSQISLGRQQLTLADAQRNLQEAQDRVSAGFDSYTYDIAIADAKLSLDRKTEDLEKAKRDLNDAKKDFDDNTLENAIDDAELNRDRKQNDYRAAQNEYSEAQKDYEAILLEDAPPASKEDIAAAEKRRDDAKKAMDTASRAFEDAKTSLDRAEDNLERAQDDAIDAATDKLTSAQNAYDDAVRAYEKAINDKTRAINDFAESSQTELENAQNTYADAQKQVASSQNSVQSSQNSLQQAESKPATQGTSVEIQELNLERLKSQLEECRIIATADGVITEINARVGAVPSGVMFVIEDTEDLYVSAKVKEHNLTDISTGQEATVTAEATGDTVYPGTVSFVSPKAVSAAGSTSVEFEVRADLTEPDTAIKIGMNAFLNIITERKSDIYAVPSSAIVTSERGSFVYTMQDGERQAIAVMLGIRSAARVEIISDSLHDGMELIVDPQGMLSDGNAQSGMQPMMFGGRG